MAYQNANGSFTSARLKCPVTGKGKTKTFSTRREAETYEGLAREALAQGYALPDGLPQDQDTRLEAVVQRLLDEHYLFKAQTTYETADSALKAICSFFGKSTLIRAVLTSAQCTRLLQHHRDRGVSASYINSQLSYMRTLVRYAIRWGYIDRAIDVPDGVTNPPSRLEWLGMEEAQHLISHLPAKYQPLARFMNATGLRISEARALTLRDINGRVASVLGKGKKRRHVPLSDTALAAIAEMRVNDPDVQIFNNCAYQTFARKMQEAVERSGLDIKFTSHTFRHSFASRLMQKDVELRNLSALLGHTNPQTTLRYAHLSDKWMDEVTSKLD